MKRRTLLKAAAAAAGAASWPGWLREAFAASDCPPGATAVQLAAAYRRAAKVSKPLLVFVIPDDNGEKWERGQLFGELLNYASDETMALLASCEVLCATMADLRKLAPSAPTDVEPLAVLVDPGAAAPKVRSLHVPSVRAATRASTQNQDWQQREALRETAEADQLRRAVAGLKQLVAPDREGAVERRARALEAHLSADVAGRLEETLANRSASLEGLESIALARAFAAPDSPLWARLAGLGRRRLKDVPVPGAHWAHHGGCGTTIEGIPDDEQMMVACGMGHVPEKRERFLYFFALPAKRG